jgi:hypothetical protein
MRRYSDPVEVRSGSRLGTVQGTVPRRSGRSGAGTVEVDGLVDGLADDALNGGVNGERDGGADGGADGGVDELVDGREAVDVAEPGAFIWHGRLYVVRRVLAHWRERRSWWRDALDPVPGQPTGIDVASREQHVWRVEASRGQAFGTGVFDLTSDGAEGADADWRLVRVAD